MTEPPSTDVGHTQRDAAPPLGQFPLENLQRWLQAILIQPLSHDDQPPAEWLPAAWREQGLEALIRPSRKLSARQHLEIYQRSYLARLRDCMATQFRALAYALGADLFQMFADQYLQQYPSTSHTLADLGARFPQFLAETRPDSATDEPDPWPEFIIELARFEYELSVLFDTVADESVCATKQEADEGGVGLNPLSRLFRHRYPVVAYYRQFTGGQQPELPLQGISYAAVVRHEFRLGLIELQPIQYHLLNRLAAGDSFPIARQRTIDQHQLDPSRFDRAWSQWQARWLKAGLVFSVTARGDRI